MRAEGKSPPPSDRAARRRRFRLTGLSAEHADILARIEIERGEAELDRAFGARAGDCWPYEAVA